MTKFLELSEYAEMANSAYVAHIEQITEIEPIEGSDNLVKTWVAGYPIVTDKSVKVGDIMVHFPPGCAINKQFLGANNLFDINSYIFNKNANEVSIILKEADKAKKKGDIVLYDELKAKAKSMCGFFSKSGKVRVINLMKQPSQGFIIPFEKSFNAWLPDTEFNSKDYINKTFDTVNGKIKKYVDNNGTIRLVDEEFTICKKFIPGGEKKPVTQTPLENKYLRKKNKHLEKFDKMIDGQFQFHTKPSMLNDNMFKLTPETIVQISSKWHGTSYVSSKILCRKTLSKWEKIKNFFGFKVKKFTYDSIYSSSGVIKNKYINPNKNDFYSKDIWGAVNDILYPYLDEGMIAYGEAVGYLPDSEKMIQKEYDYGCDVGKFKIIIYRLVKVQSNGDRTEMTSQEIRDWVKDKLKMNSYNFFNNPVELPFTPVYEFYYGRMDNLYPDVPIDNDWHKNILKKLVNDKRFHMEEDCVFCKHNVPTEGIIVRVEDGSNQINCFKLKCTKFYIREGKCLDKGEIDIETEESEKPNDDENNAEE